MQELLGAVFGKPRQYEHTPAMRELIFDKKRKRPRGHCHLCGIWRRSLHRDHIIPKRLGGADDESNIQYICANCHEEKTRGEMEQRWADPEYKRSRQGWTHSEESKQKMSDKVRGKPKTAAHRRRLSEALHGKPLSEEHRQKISEGLLRRKTTLTEEHRRKISESQRRRLARQRQALEDQPCPSSEG